jgi:acyl-CoA synthetase
VDQPFGRTLTPPHLQRRYLQAGLWDATPVSVLLSGRLRAHATQSFRVWSKSSPRAMLFGQLDELARRCAAGLRARGVRCGDRVVFQLPNSVEAAVTLLGVAMLGAVAVPVATFYGRKELVEIVNASGARFLVIVDQIAERRYADEARDSRPQMPDLDITVVSGSTVGSDEVAFTQLLDAEPISALARSNPDSACMIAFTSGTSGRPKGVIHTHRSLGAEIRSHLSTMVPSGAHPQVVASPIAHAAGMTLGLLAPVYRGAPVNLADNFDVDYILDVCRQHELAPGGGAAIFLSALIDHPGFTDDIAERMGYVILGGSAVPGALVTKAGNRGVSVLRSYGLTEHPTVSACRIDDDPQQRGRTDGRPLPGVEVAIRQPSGVPAPAGVEGQIFTRGPDCCAGYTDPDLTDSAFDSDGWFTTGDLGVLDHRGHLTITGRQKDLIIRNGVNISPTEVENALLACPAIEEVAVVGVPHDKTGERAVAFIATRDGIELSLSDLRTHLAGLGLAKPKWPEELRLVHTFPRTASGKVQKFALRAMVQAPT